MIIKSCNDYKILTKILSSRLKNILSQIISEDQTCSIPKRTVFNNLFLVRDLIKVNKKQNTSFYILQVDQEKAFDKVAHDLLYKTMRTMGFSDQFINVIQIIYKNNTSFIINNGFLSSLVHLQRVLRQGYLLSLPPYVVQGEVTTTNINQNENIEGIRIPNNTKQVKIGQYADDSNFLI